MKKLPLFLLLATGLFSNAASNKKGSIDAKIDGCKFELKDGGKYAGRVSAESQTAIITFYGADIKDKDGSTHKQKINVEYALNDAGQAIVKGVVFEFREQKFNSLPNSASLNVSKLEWSKDKKSYVLNANFECLVQKPQTSEMFEGVIGIKGSMEDVKVNVWPGDVALTEEE